MGILIGGILPAILFGLTGMLQKYSVKAGIGTSLYMAFIGIGVLTTSGFLFLAIPDKTLSIKSGMSSILIGMLWALGTGLIAISLFKYGVPISKLVPLYNMNTLVAVLLSLIVFSEWQQVNMAKLVIGAILIIIGGVLVSRA